MVLIMMESVQGLANCFGSSKAPMAIWRIIIYAKVSMQMISTLCPVMLLMRNKKGLHGFYIDAI